MNKLIHSFALSLLFLFCFYPGDEAFAQQRNPVLEKFTGIWDPWSPCGDEIADEILDTISNSIILSYHGPANGSDPFSFFSGNTVIGMLSPPYWPTGTADRTGAPDTRGLWMGQMTARNSVPATVAINVCRTFNSTTREFSATIDFTALTNLNGQYMFSVILLESGMIWNQAGNGSCPGGSSYVHNHVVRDMMNGASGNEIINGTWNVNDVITKSINRTIPHPGGSGPDMVWDSCDVVVMVYESTTQLYNSEIQQAIEMPLTTFQLSVSITNGWNMVSIPGLHPTNQDVTTWWPNLTGNVYKFSGSYTPVDTAETGEGYWMKNSGANVYETGDEWPAGGIQIVPYDTISATTGWNMIGGYEDRALTSRLTTDPPGLISGSVFGYSGAYNPADTLVPGYGYWIKLTGDGDIIIPCGQMAKGSVEVVEYIQEDWGKIIITDNAERSYTLYAVNGEVNLDKYELPPMPPQGIFDIRYGSGRIAEDINSSIQTIDMSGVTYPLTVRVEGMDMRLMDETGRTVNVNLKSGEDVVISDATIKKLVVSGGKSIPTVYALEQNYPNPFNPSTTIEFSLPEDVSNVKLSIYNALGERVAEIVNTSLVAGKYQYQWNAKNVATGMYIYELRTDKFVSVKKMVLMK